MTGAGYSALITGASSGIGAAFARELAQRGYDLILVARRKDRLDQLAAEIHTRCGVKVDVLPADLTLEEGVAQVEAKIAGMSNLDLVVNNAGFGSRGRFWEADLETQNRMHRLHVLATMRLTRAALHGMMEKDRGGIINVSSVAGFAASPGGASYSATKAWMNTFTESLAMELDLAGSHVKVQSLCPGFTYTEFHDVLGVDRNVIPKGWWTAAETVVAESLRGLERGKLFVIPGARYKLMVGVTSIVPGWLRRAGTRIYARRTHRA